MQSGIEKVMSALSSYSALFIFPCLKNMVSELGVLWNKGKHDPSILQYDFCVLRMYENGKEEIGGGEIKLMTHF